LKKKLFNPKKRATCFGLYSNHQVFRRIVLRQNGVNVAFTEKSYDRPTASSTASSPQSVI